MATRPNVLWIQCDELRCEALGCYARRWPAQTPNLDALAQRGVRFDETYCNSPVCVASRTSLLAGRYPHELGVYHNEASINGHVLPGDLVTWPQALAAAGYQTISFGKCHTPQHPIWQQRHGWPKRGDGGYRRFAGRDKVLPADAVQLPGPPHVVIGGCYPGDDQTPGPAGDLTDLALDWLDAAPSEPWLARVSFNLPHTPVVAPRPFYERFDPADYAYDPELDQPTDDSPPFERFIATAQRSGELLPEQVASARRAYFAATSYVDHQLGRLLDRLAALGLDSNTIVVFDADHGEGQGELGVWQKQCFTRPVHRVPQLLACPGLLPDGQVRGDLNELVDRGPTLLALCGVPRPEGMRGRALFGDEPEPEAIGSLIGYGQPTSVLYPLVRVGPVTPRRACLRTRRWRYDVSIRVGGEDLPPDDPRREPTLVDRHADPDERVNLSGAGELAEVEHKLSAGLDSWLALDAGVLDPRTVA